MCSSDFVGKESVQVFLTAAHATRQEWDRPKACDYPGRRGCLADGGLRWTGWRIGSGRFGFAHHGWTLPDVIQDGAQVPDGPQQAVPVGRHVLCRHLYALTQQVPIRLQGGDLVQHPAAAGLDCSSDLGICRRTEVSRLGAGLGDDPSRFCNSRGDAGLGLGPGGTGSVQLVGQLLFGQLSPLGGAS